MCHFSLLCIIGKIYDRLYFLSFIHDCGSDFYCKLHYRWTYFFAITLFFFLFGGMLMVSSQWQRALNFSSVLFVVLMLFHRLKFIITNSLLLISDFFLVVDWRNWETLIHYKGALFGVIGLLALLGYAISGFNDVESLGVLGNSIGALLFIVSFSLMWHYSKNPSAVQVWLDSLPDDGRDVFLNLPMSCRGIFFQGAKF